MVSLEKPQDRTNNKVKAAACLEGGPSKRRAPLSNHYPEVLCFMANPYGVPKGAKCIGWKHPYGNFSITDYRKSAETGLGEVRIDCHLGGLGCLGAKGKWIRKTDIRPEGTNSCGCMKKSGLSERQLTHGDSRQDAPYFMLYEMWKNMLSRCKPGFSQAADYYHKGIRTCPEWQKYPTFKEWALEQGWSEGLSIERDDNDKGYDPRNCRLIPQREQGRNTKRIIHLDAFGERKSLSGWSRDDRCKVGYNTLRVRIVMLKWESERAISTPSRNQGSDLGDETRLRNILSSMISRCTKNADQAYKNYGGRMISVCEQWASEADSFVSWAMESGYEKGLSLERKDNNRGYEPSNCAWVTRKANNDNRRNSVQVTVNGVTKAAEDWARDKSAPKSVDAELIRRRIRDGWTGEEAVLTPKGMRRSRSGGIHEPQLGEG